MKYMLDTKHLRVIKLRFEDAQRLYENHLEEEVKKWITNESYASIEETQEVITFYIDCVSNNYFPHMY